MHDRSSGIGRDAACDPLSEVLQDLRLAGVSYGHCRLTRPWGVRMPAKAAARMHVVVAGKAWLRADDFGPVELGAGDVAFIPQGAAHSLADTPRGRTRPLSAFPLEEIGDRTYRLNWGGNGSQTLMACCAIEFREPTLHPVLELMPPALVVSGTGAADTTLPALLDAMADEVIAQRVGAATMLARLADVVVIRLIRMWVEAQCHNTTGWLAAIRDPQIGRALASIHRYPERDWSIDNLAITARLSRSVFCERFAMLVGMPPGRYLARWRMHLASTWLRSRRATVTEVAAKLGYESEAGFSRAFKRLLGTPPSALRKLRRGVEADAS
ncbi:MAG: AraC family transcriptional regulator [Geminicoccaceae bacterium]